VSAEIDQRKGALGESPKWRRLVAEQAETVGEKSGRKKRNKKKNKRRKRKPLKTKLPIRGRDNRNSERTEENPDAPLARTFLIDEFMEIPAPSVKSILGPVIQERGVTMISGEKGVGKTFVSMAIAMAVASGRNLFGWECAEPQSVMYMDPELTVSTLQTRLKMICDSLRLDSMPRGLSIWSAAAQYPAPPPNFAKSSQIDALVKQCRHIDFLVVDSLSALMRGVDLNTAQAYEAVEDLFLGMRHRGTAVLLVQHLGKDVSRGPRGTSKQEDLLDVSLSLKKSSKQGGQTTITMTCRKMRHYPESDFNPLEIEFGYQDGYFKMTQRSLAIAKTDQIIQRYKELEADGLVKRGTFTQISEELGVSPSQVTKAVQKYKRSKREY